MEPEVRYCTTSDGVRIAYTVTGEGPVLVLCSDPISSHVQLEWSHPVMRPLLEELARHNTLVCLDPRGAGLSERKAPAFMEDSVRDIEAVVDRLQLDHFAISVMQNSTPAVVELAARHSDRVHRFVIIDGFLRFGDVIATPQVTALIGAAASDWEMATESIGAIAFGPGREESRDHGAFIRACIPQDYFATVTPAFAGVDVTAAARTLQMPVLVVRHAGLRWITDETTQHLLTSIPDARLVTIAGTWADDPAGLGRRIAAFVNEGESRATAPGARIPSGVRTVVFTDIVGHTEMMRRLGDAKGREVLREHERITRETLKRHGGTEVKTMGDGFMASFGSVSQAMECAVALQRRFHEQNREPGNENLEVRVGLNAGEPIADEGDLFGETVILASRIAAHAGRGEILIPEPVRHLLAGKGFLFADRGEFLPKGFEDAVRLYEVRWRE